MNKEIFFSEDHRVEIIIQEIHTENIPQDILNSDASDIKPKSQTIKNSYNISSQLHCSIKYHIDNAITPVVINMGNLLYITSYIDSESSVLKEHKIITIDNIFIPNDNINSLRLFTHNLVSMSEGNSIPVITYASRSLNKQHTHTISYCLNKKWTHRYCGVTIDLILTEKTIKKFADEFIKLMNALDMFYISHFTQFQSKYSNYLDITAQPIVVNVEID